MYDLPSNRTLQLGLTWTALMEMTPTSVRREPRHSSVPSTAIDQLYRPPPIFCQQPKHRDQARRSAASSSNHLFHLLRCSDDRHLNVSGRSEEHTSELQSLRHLV